MKTWIGILLAVVVIGGGYWWWQNSQNSSDAGASAPVGTDAGGGDASAQANAPSGGNAAGGQLSGSVSASVGASKTVDVSFNGSSFTPNTVSINAGDTVRWSSTGGAMWVASGVHPTHTVYDGTDVHTHCASGYAGPAPFDECGPGTSYSFTFDKAGTWRYHDHLDAAVVGTVIVK